jgi:hypothetical protein
MIVAGIFQMVKMIFSLVEKTFNLVQLLQFIDIDVLGG